MLINVDKFEKVWETCARFCRCLTESYAHALFAVQQKNSSSQAQSPICVDHDRLQENRPKTGKTKTFKLNDVIQSLKKRGERNMKMKSSTKSCSIKSNYSNNWPKNAWIRINYRKSSKQQKQYDTSASTVGMTRRKSECSKSGNRDSWRSAIINLSWSNKSRWDKWSLANS